MRRPGPPLTGHQWVPIAIAGWFVGFLVLRILFAAHLEAPITAPKANSREVTPFQRMMLVLLACVLTSYPLFGSIGGPVWAVASVGALLSLLLAHHHLGITPARLAREGVSWETLAFLCAVLIMSLGLKEVGLVDRLASLYGESGLLTVGLTSAVGSAVLNNHPMSHLNMMALTAISSAGSDLRVFAALVGGDLGPRLLPMGSLAGLLWFEILRRHGVNVGIWRFMTVGILIAAPTIAVSLAILSLR